MDEYIDALLLELDERFLAMKQIGLELLTIYIGGGTPTTLTAVQLERIFKKIC